MEARRANAKNAEDRAAEGRQQMADRRDAVADERDRLADQRDAVADGRDRLADQREAAADERERLADQRDAAADERDRLADQREEEMDAAARRLGCQVPSKRRRAYEQLARSRGQVAANREQMDRIEASLRRLDEREWREQQTIETQVAESNARQADPKQE